MNVEQFKELLIPVISAVAGKPLNKELAGLLNEKFPAGGETYKSVVPATKPSQMAGCVPREAKAGGLAALSRPGLRRAISA